MTRTTTYGTETHNTYRGELTLFDFEGHHTLSTMADRIMRDLRFDEQCRKNCESRERMKNR